MSVPSTRLVVLALLALLAVRGEVGAQEVSGDESAAIAPAELTPGGEEQPAEGEAPAAEEPQPQPAAEAPASAAERDEIEESVVKLNVTARAPDFFRPWTKAAPNKGSGSGAVIAGNRILTNAHVVMHASEVFVQLRKGGDQLTGRVTAIAPGIDLAIVEVKDPSALEGLKPLELATELPALKSRISVYGYPQGGDDLSITEGSVSRIEFTGYNFGTAGLRIQVDAAINPGNSGGPAIQNGKITGIAFSKIQNADNIGYVIPAEEIQTFLTDAADGKYEGNSLLFDDFQTAENEGLRAYLKIPADKTGLVVNRPYRDEDDYPLKKWDLVTHVGPHSIDNQGYVEVKPGLRLRFLYYVPRLAAEGKVELTLVRDGETMVVNVPVSPDRELLIPTLKDSYPDYFIYGPLVFTPATQEYIRAIGSSGTTLLAALDSPVLKRLYERPAEPGEQLVVTATRMFPHPITKGYDNRPFSVISRVNGHDVKNLKQLIELLREAEDEFVRFETADRNESLVFRRADIEESSEQILEDEGIRYQASEELRDVWNGDE